MENKQQTEKEGQRIDELIRALVEKKGVAEAEREAEIERVYEEVMDRMMDELAQTLPEEAIKELDEKLEQPEFTPEELFEFIDKSGVRLESVLGKVIDEFSQEYLGDEYVAEKMEAEA